MCWSHRLTESATALALSLLASGADAQSAGGKDACLAAVEHSWLLVSRITMHEREAELFAAEQESATSLYDALYDIIDFQSRSEVDALFDVGNRMRRARLEALVAEASAERLKRDLAAAEAEERQICSEAW